MHFLTLSIVIIHILFDPFSAVAGGEGKTVSRLSVNDFAYGLILDSKSRSPIYQVSLPTDVYQGVLRPDLGDIRVFNASGNEVPHLLESSRLTIFPKGKGKRKSTVKGSSASPAFGESTHKVPVPASIPFFPLYGSFPAGTLAGGMPPNAPQNTDDDSVPNDLSMKIVQNTHGTIIRVESGRMGNQTIAPPLSGYLLDMTSLQAPPVSLELQWRGTEDNNFIATIHVKGSNDLNHWTRLAQSTLAKLQFSGHAIDQFRIPLPSSGLNGGKKSSGYRYLHLSWPVSDQGVTLNSVTALTKASLPEKKREWLDLGDGRFHKENPMIIEYETGGFFPVDAIQLKLQEKNSIIRASLQSRSHHHQDQDVWRHRCQGIFYSLQVSDTHLSNDIFTFSGTSDDFWRVVVESDGAGLADAHARGDAPPILQLGWHPHALIFLARGEEPFTLAWGSGKLKAHSRRVPPSDMILQAIADSSGSHDKGGERSGNMIATVMPGKKVVLGGKRALELPSPPLPWKKWLLWTVLIAGVVLVGGMTWKLARQLKPS